MYGIKQLACIDFDNLVKLLALHRYFPVWKSPGLWKHQIRSTVFTLCVDGFSIKANSMEDADHLINSIRKYFNFSIDRGGQNYLDLTLYWKYTKKYVDIYMPRYIPTALKNSNTNHQHVPKTPHIHGINLFMENTCNYTLNKFLHQKSTPHT